LSLLQCWHMRKIRQMSQLLNTYKEDIMRNFGILFLLLGLICFISCSQSQQAEKTFKIDLPLGEFGAFYTKLNSGAEFEKYSRTGDYADIVVDLGKDNAMFIFWRGTSFLPYLQVGETKWSVTEVIPRKGDGTEKMPDRTNTYSVVKLIDDGPDQVVIHWRYLPEFKGGNPQVGPASDKFVDEYFTIKPDGSVKRTIRKGTERIDLWRVPDNKITETFTLTANGITNVNITYPQVDVTPQAVEGNPVVTDVAADPVAWWKFDEAKGDFTTESVSNTQSEIAGNKSLWRKGVSGTALQFDGYFSAINLPASKAPKISNAITLEGWVVIGAYPWSFVPIIQQSSDEPEVLLAKKGNEAFLIGEDEREDMEEPDASFDFVLKEEDDSGYFLGLDGYGNPTFKLRVGGKWEQLITKKVLERRTWYHVTATYDGATGLMAVYVDGKKVGEKEIAKGAIELANADVKIGKGKNRRPIRPVRSNTFSDSYSLDGMIDEVKIYDVALTADQVGTTYQTYFENKKMFAEVDMDKRVLPEGENRGEFGAYFTHLRFYDVWDNLWRFSDHPDVVVEFDTSPAKFIFWRGVGYIPMMVNDKGQWYSNEFNETWNRSGGEGCQEPMSDKESYNNHARIIENTPARTVVHWRYPLIDVKHVMANYSDETGWCDWSDWYYYIYPDGIAVKLMHLWTDGLRDHEWQESMAIFGPDQHPEQIIHTKNALTMLNLAGDYKTYDWVTGPPDNVLEPKGQAIQYVNYTGEYKPITIGQYYEEESSNVYGGEITEYAVFPTWNHWPVAQMPSDGRYATYPDRTAHSSLTHVFIEIYDEELEGPTPFYQKILMEGMLNLKPKELIPLARSWMQAPAMADLKGAKGDYDQAQRAYVLEKEAEVISLMIEASKKSPVYNLAFVVKNWGDKSTAKVKVDGNELAAGSGFRQGTIRDTDGTATQIIWIEKQTSKPVTVEISK